MFFVFNGKQQLNNVPSFFPKAEILPEMQNMEDAPRLISEALLFNCEAQHLEPTLLQICTVKLVDFRKIQDLNALIISKGNVHAGGNYD